MLFHNKLWLKRTLWCLMTMQIYPDLIPIFLQRINGFCAFLTHSFAKLHLINFFWNIDYNFWCFGRNYRKNHISTFVQLSTKSLISVKDFLKWSVVLGNYRQNYQYQKFIVIEKNDLSSTPTLRPCLPERCKVQLQRGDQAGWDSQQPQRWLMNFLYSAAVDPRT